MVLDIKGKTEIVLNDNDFSYLIEKYMGSEAKDYFDELVDDYETTIKGIQEELQASYDVQDKLQEEIYTLQNDPGEDG